MPGWLSSLRDLIAEASPLRRFMLALLVLLPLAALAAAYVWFNPPAYRVLYAQLSDRAGGEVIAALEQLDIPYRLSAADGTIEVPADQLHVARYRLAARGLPKSDADAQDEVDRAPSFGASSLQEQQRYQHALEIDLARSIQTLDAVELARVHLALPKVSPFLRDAPPATAAVLVRLRPGAQLSSRAGDDDPDPGGRQRAAHETRRRAGARSAWRAAGRCGRPRPPSRSVWRWNRIWRGARWRC